MEQQKFSVRARLKSFVYAYEGLSWFFRREHNAWIHAVAAILVLTLAVILSVSRLELIVIFFAIGMVWMAELFNTAIEKIMDHLSPALHPDVKLIKDLASAAVMVAAIAAAIIGLLIFVPKML